MGIKVSQMPSTNTLTDNDLVMVVQDNENKKINKKDLQNNLTDPSLTKKVEELEKENAYLNNLVEQAFDKKEVEGEELSIDNTIEARMDLKLKGNTSQQQYSGKNLLPLIKGDYNVFNNNVNWKIHNEIIVYNRTNEDIQGGAINLVTGAVGQWGNEGKDLQLKPNTTYTLSFIANGNYTKKENTTAFIHLYFTGNKFLYIQNKNSNNKYATTLTTDDKGYFGVSLYGQYVTCTNFMIYNIQLEEGSTATDYEPYVGGTASPNPDYPQDIKVVSGDNTIKISNSNNTLSQSFPISLGSLELCKIGDYQDYIYKKDNKWWKHKEIGKANNPKFHYNGKTSKEIEMITAQFSNVKNDQNYILNINNSFGIRNHRLTFRMPLNLVSGSTEQEIGLNAETYINSKDIIAYYILNTSTEEEITDTTLISQLEALKTAMSYTEQTNISQINNGIPFYLDVIALTK